MSEKLLWTCGILVLVVGSIWGISVKIMDKYIKMNYPDAFDKAVPKIELRDFIEGGTTIYDKIKEKDTWAMGFNPINDKKYNVLKKIRKISGVTLVQKRF